MRNVVIVLVVLAVLAGGYFLVAGNKSKTTMEKTSTETQQQPTNPPVGGGEPGVSEVMMKETTVTLTQNGFEPQSVTLKKGEKVVWINNSGSVATVDSSKHPTHLDYPPLNLGQFDDGAKVELVFTESGTYKYHDHLHPQRFGTVVVE